MNTTPIISNTDLTYSVLTSQISRSFIPKMKEHISVILLNRGRWIFRPSLLREIEELGVTEIISVELPPFKVDFAELLDEFPNIRFLLFSKTTTTGELINLAVRESHCDYCLVLWDDQKIPERSILMRTIKAWDISEAFFVVPELLHENLALPTLMIPSLWRNRLKILTFSSEEAHSYHTLFPFDYTGLFLKTSFLSTGGYDRQLLNPFWQKAEWGLRCCLWGESFVQSSIFKITYRSDPPLEDQTYDNSYKKFFLKTMAVRFQRDHGELLWGKFWNYWRNSGLGWGMALKDFLAAREWVRTHRYRYKTDLKTLLELWGQSTGGYF